ncbi:MAG TPA: hypothetical protein ENK75_03595 [Saprospiraceae bacterium]|nr:hypothetical protein [Saprospiraceae bacterium]
MENKIINLSVDPVEFSSAEIDNLKWTDHTASACKGLQSLVLSGDIHKAGLFTQRVRLSANCRINPHFHPDGARMVTVISGTLYFAYGDEFNATNLKALPEGSYFTEPKNEPHYAMTKDEVVLQVIGIGPVEKTQYLV